MRKESTKQEKEKIENSTDLWYQDNDLNHTILESVLDCEKKLGIVFVSPEVCS